MLDLITKFFDDSFASRWNGTCGGWTQELVIAHAIADGLIWLAYMVIPIILILLIRARRDIPFNLFFVLFAIFILGCGFTHLMGMITPFAPYYYVDFWVKFLTAIASVCTACTLIHSYKAIVTIPNPFLTLLEMEKTQSKLVEVNSELEQFAYIASHDLKAPLRAINNLAQWITEDMGDSLSVQSKNHLRLMRDRITRMNALIEGILQYSRIGRVYTEKRQVDLNKTVTAILDTLDKKQFTFEVQTLPSIFGNDTVLFQLFGNLISNAIKHHTKEDGKIQVTCEQDEGFYRFGIIDDGPGIPKELQNKLFILFQTLARPTDATSTGIGLALCKKIVEESGGRIWVDSDVGLGTKFFFTWPI